MVTPVENLTPIQNLPVYNVPPGAANVADAGQINLGLGSPIGSGLSPLNLDTANMNYSVYGPMAYNQRVMKAYTQDMNQSGYDYENLGITQDDQNNLQPLSDRLDEYRVPVFDIRLLNKEEVTEGLENVKNSGKGIGLYLTNCAKDGIKDSNQRVSFENLKNPLRLIKQLKSVSFNTPEANENIDILSDIAVKERSPALAACLLEGTAKGGVTSVGVDSKTAQKLLIDSRSKFDNEGEYYHYLTDIDKAYKKMFPGKSLDGYIKNNYKPTSQKAASVALIGIGCLLGGPVVGTIVGALAGAALYSSGWFGQNEQGKQLLKTIDKARNIDNDVDINNYTFGQNTVPTMTTVY